VTSASFAKVKRNVAGAPDVVADHQDARDGRARASLSVVVGVVALVVENARKGVEKRPLVDGAAPPSETRMREIQARAARRAATDPMTMDDGCPRGVGE